MQLQFALIILAVVGVIALVILIPAPPEPGLDIECVSDTDCGTGGCSGEICGPHELVQDMITPCMYKPEYDCLRLTRCGCISGKCRWVENQAYLDCMEELGG